MTCNACGDAPKKKDNSFTKAVVEINNPETLVLFRKVVIPASMGTEEQVPAAIGKYHNVILKYEANRHVYLYSSDGIPTLLEMDVPQEVWDSIDELQDEIDEIKNNPDVVDIVATYADLQNYDTSSLGDKDVIRVLTDETHDGESSYYRWSTATQTWTFIGATGPYYTKDETNTIVDAAKGKAKELTAEDYDWPIANPDGVAVWALSPGFYHAVRGVKMYWTSTSQGVNIAPYEFIIAEQGNSGDKAIFALPDHLYTTHADGSVILDTTYLKSSQVVDSLASTAAYLPLSANQGKVLDEKITAINSATSYSAVEVDTGTTWLDGSKIYKKTINVGALPDTATFTVPHGITGLNKIIKAEGWAYDTTTNLAITTGTTLIGGSNVLIVASSTHVGWGTTADYSHYTESYITLYYTKNS